MPAPSLKALKTLKLLADLKWQEERRALAEAQVESAVRQAALGALERARAAEREAQGKAMEADGGDLLSARAAAAFEGWAKTRAGALTDALAEAEREEDAARAKAAEEFGRLRALDHLEDRAQKEVNRLRRAAEERDGQPES